MLHLALKLLCVCKSVMTKNFSSTQPKAHERTWVAQNLWKEVLGSEAGEMEWLEGTALDGQSRSFSS